jgi:hypothetical protein
MRHYSSNLWTNIYGKTQLVYWVQKFCIWLLFVSIQFEIDWIVFDRPNIVVTYLIVDLMDETVDKK